jgi:hypothetical protein
LIDYSRVDTPFWKWQIFTAFNILKYSNIVIDPWLNEVDRRIKVETQWFGVIEIAILE